MSDDSDDGGSSETDSEADVDPEAFVTVDGHLVVNHDQNPQHGDDSDNNDNQ